MFLENTKVYAIDLSDNAIMAVGTVEYSDTINTIINDITSGLKCSFPTSDVYKVGEGPAVEINYADTASAFETEKQPSLFKEAIRLMNEGLKRRAEAC